MSARFADGKGTRDKGSSVPIADVRCTPFLCETIEGPHTVRASTSADVAVSVVRHHLRETTPVVLAGFR
jgi:hypothetical protein